MLWKLHGNQFLKLSPNSNGFVAIPHDMGNWWENPCISHMMKYTTRFDANGKDTHTMETAWEPIS